MAGIQVYGLRKPTLTLTLEDGGSFIANTTYYIFGIMRSKKATGSYYCTYGALSDVSIFTTTDTARSIRINHKTYRDISAFSDASDGKTNVISTKHCLVTDDDIHIPDGSYGGEYPITRTDYHNFIIDASFVGTEVGTFYTDTPTYNESFGMTYYISITNPFEENGNYYWNYTSGGITRFTDHEWGTTKIEQDVLITSQPIARLYSTGSPHMIGLAKGPLEFLEDDGTIGVYITQTKTFEEIYDEVQLSGFTKNSFFTSNGCLKTFFLAGSIYVVNPATLTETAATINILSGEIRTNVPANISLTKCNVSIMFGGYKNRTKIYVPEGVYYNGSFNATAQEYPIFGDKGTMFCNLALSNTPSDSVEDGIHVLSDKTYRMIGTQLFGRFYFTTKFKNMTFYGTTADFQRYLPGVLTPNFDWLENVKILDRSYNNAHIRSYEYEEKAHHIRSVNVDTDASNNEKIIYTYSNIANLRWDFYRRISMKVINEDNVAIEDALIKIIDNTLQEYNFSTDASGNVTIEVMEQKSMQQPGGYSENTLYNNFVMKISKNNYQTLIIEYPTLYGYDDIIQVLQRPSTVINNATLYNATIY